MDPVRRSGTGGVTEVEAARPPALRRYTAPPTADDPVREAQLGAVLQALGNRSLSRDELARHVDTDGWGSGRLDAVVAHGIATHVLVETGDGAVRARYVD